MKKRKRPTSWGLMTRPGEGSSIHDEVELGLAEGVMAATDSRAGAWLQSRLLPFADKRGTFVGSVIPTGFPAYARVFHPANIGGRLGGSTTDPVRWSDVALWSGRTVHPEMQWEAISQPPQPVTGGRPWAEDPRLGQLPPDVRTALVDILAAHTSTPDLCWICIWTGFAGLDDDVFSNLPRVELPYRSYFLLRVPLKAIGTGPLFVGPPIQRLGPNIWWPDDLAWCVATEIDFRWTYVGGSRQCIDDVLGDERLEALPATPEQRADALSDRINLPVERY